jgi:DNA polymerase-3 subunit chi
MTRIDFYILPGSDPHARRLTACRLVEKAYRQGHRLYLRTDSEEETRLFDDLLWTFRQGSFVPHELAETADRETPVVISHISPPPELCDVLVNLGSEVAEGFGGFERVAEIVDQQESIKRTGRLKYKYYQSEGYEIQTHQLDRA